MARLKGELIAPRALDWLASATEPRIHSLYRQSINLIESKQSLLSVVLPELGPGPFAIVVAQPEPSFEGFNLLGLESPINIDGRRVEIGHLQVDAGRAKEWQPRPDWQRLGEELDGARISRLAALLHDYAPSGSFAPLAHGAILEASRTIQSRALSAAAGPTQLLVDSLASGDDSGVGEAAMSLAGLGGGVTPSGDDYLQGSIHALWTERDERRARQTGEVIVSIATPRTNAISGEWLRAAARGEAGADWHLMVQAIVENRGVDEAVIQLIHRGHTSGADAMAGFLSTLSVLN